MDIRKAHLDLQAPSFCVELLANGGKVCKGGTFSQLVSEGSSQAFRQFPTTELARDVGTIITQAEALADARDLIKTFLPVMEAIAAKDNATFSYDCRKHPDV